MRCSSSFAPISSEIRTEGATGSRRRVRPRQSPGERNLSIAGRERVPYLRRMLLRAAVLSISLAACGFASEPASAVSDRTAEVDQTVIHTCAQKDDPCDPFDRDGNAICPIRCSGDGGDGYCMPYSTVEEVWCANHPDQWFSPSKLCGPSGDPTWPTHCAPGFLP
jgi:hypothetical protein